MRKIWKTIPKHENYLISNCWEIKNKTTNKLLKITESNGSPNVSLSRNGKTKSFRVRTLVELTFKGYAKRQNSSLTKEDVESIRSRYIKRAKGQTLGNARELASEFGIHICNVRRIANGLSHGDL